MCDYIFLCLPTPMNSDGSCNIDLIENTVEKLSKSSTTKGIVIKSTIIPGTTDYLNQKYDNLQTAFNPEFLTERNAVNDYNNQKRIIIGGPRPLTSDLKQVFTKVFPKAHIVKQEQVMRKWLNISLTVF